MDDDQFRQLLAHFDLSWKGYRKVRKGVKKRIRRHMRGLGCHEMNAYLESLVASSLACRECELLLTVPISRFFRDRRLWEILAEKWLPGMVALHPGRMNVWSAGCASGEEPYSFKIIWHQLQKRIARLPKLTLLATDRHPQNLERARTGIYAISSLKEVEPDLRDLYFSRREGGSQFAVKRVLKGGIVWQIHHLLSPPPLATFNIIFLRNNVLTYYQKETQIRCLEPILDLLAPGGLLVIGCHEKLPAEIAQMRTLDPLTYVFKKDSS